MVVDECPVSRDAIADRSVVVLVALIERQRYVAVVEPLPAGNAAGIDAEELEAVEGIADEPQVLVGERLVRILGGWQPLLL